jgi:DNA polymerase I-like protein with 3'-5' exonuclease and polymerase domains
MSYIALKPDSPELYVSREPADIEKLYGKSPLGLDLEWNADGLPRIIGLSDGKLHVSVPYAEGRIYFLRLLTKFPSTAFVGHNIVGADLAVLAKDGIHIQLNMVEDTIIRHWLVNPHLSKGTGKSALEEDEGEKRGRGFNNLGTMASIYTNLPHWKDCRLEGCTGPCPIHDEYGYNGLDSAAPVLALPALKRTMALRNIEHLYGMHRRLAWRLNQMREFGVHVDIPYIETLRREFDADKATLAQTFSFNPDSPQQVKLYFRDRFNLSLIDAKEQTVRDLVDTLGEDDAPDELIHLLDYKELGNGPDRWFKPQYRDKNGYVKGFMDVRGYVHPFIGFYTSSSRLMSSSPNFQNVAKRRVSRKICECGMLALAHRENALGHKFKGESIGKKIRRAIIAPEGYYIVRADFSNAEGRTVLYLSGYESPKVDMHEYMRQNIGLTEDESFSIALGGAREAAKSVTHACVTHDHEYLTPNGWKYISEYVAGEKIAQWDAGKITFVEPTAYHKYAFDGELNSIHGTALSAITTDEHKWPVLISGTDGGRTYEKWHRVESPVLSSGKIPVSGVLEGNEVEGYSDLLIKQAVAIQADGSYGARGGVRFHLVKPRKQKRLEELFGVQGTPCKDHPGAGRQYYIAKSKSRGNPFLDDKKQFTKRLLDLSQRQRELFLAEVLLWDGSQSGGKQNAKVYVNKNYESVRWVQTIAHLSGHEALARLWHGDEYGWTVRFNRRKYADVKSLEKTTTPYCGSVYCFTVPSGYFVIKHDNRISITGNSNYLEGLQLKSEYELRHNERLRKEIDNGARLVYWDWRFGGKVVTLTGVNLSRRAFGEATLENRAKANAVVSRYIDRAFPAIRDFQRKVTRQVEAEGVVRPPHGYTLLSYGASAEDQIKQAVATYGQQPTAHISKLAILSLWDDFDAGGGLRPILQVHDELLTYARADMNPTDAMAHLKKHMEIETKEMPGFIIPAEASYGKSWADQTKEGKG